MDRSLYRYMRVDGVITESSNEHGSEISCIQCTWTRSNFTLQAARKNAHRHVAQTGHRVEVMTQRSRIYSPQTEPKE